MKLFAYAFKAGKWVETPRLSVRDVALLVDTEGRTIYIWHGPKSKIKDQNEAKKLLLSLRDRYASFQFQKVGRNPAPELQQEIKRLLGSALGTGTTRIFAILSMSLGIGGIVMAIVVMYFGFSVTDYAGYLAGDVGTSIMIFAGIEAGLFGGATVFSFLSDRKPLGIMAIIAIAMSIVALGLAPNLELVAVNVATNDTVFVTMQISMLLIEIGAIAPFGLALAIEISKIVQE